ncbi:MAG: hypothetical protein JXL97_07605 [Bacteroidales bacterium]|nr:hypothetical protein [Bacteroidales bacterium]
MNKIILSAIIMFIMSVSAFSQRVPVTVINETYELKDNQFHIRAYKGDLLKINLQTELQNEKKGKFYDLKNVKIYRQDASDDFQYIYDKNDVSKIDIELVVPRDGIYTILVERGGMTKFNSTLFVQRLAENEETAKLNKRAVYVSIPDTVHAYTESASVYDYIRTATPYTKKQYSPQYKEDQIFIDVSYALRIDNIYVIPIQIPFEIMTDYKIARSIKWGFFISVSDEVYKALQAKVSQVATAALNVGVGKAMSGKVNSETGEVMETTLTKGYAVFDKASTANAVAGITGDVGELSGNEPTTVSSDVVKAVTGFTGLTETAGNAIGSLMPKIEDEIKYKVLSRTEYQKYKNGEAYTAIQEGHGCFVQGEFDIKNPNDVFYLVIENERSTGGGFWDVAESIGKTILSQYVYANVKVFVQRKNEVMYQQGYFENTFEEVKNPVWIHSEETSSKNQIMFEDQVKPYYQTLNSPTIY